jgi:hypothetical protein
LILGDVFKRKGPLVGVLDRAQLVIKWFMSHSRALGMLKEEQAKRHVREVDAARARGQEPSGRFPILSLIFAVLTRWTSHFLACTRLLDLKTDFKVLVLTRRDDLLKMAGRGENAQEETAEVVRTLEDDEFWAKLAT